MTSAPSRNGSPGACRQAGRRADAPTTARARLHRLAARLPVVCAFLRDRSAGIAVLAAVLFPVVLGGIGLGAETSYWYMTQRRLQHAADVAAHAAAARLRAADPYEKIKGAATHIATKSGYKAGQGTLTLNIPPISGPSAGAENRVELKLTETWPRWLTGIFSNTPVVLGARAVAGLQGGSIGCVIALNRTVSGAVTVSGSTNVTLNNCNVVSNSNSPASFQMNGSSAQLSTGCVYTVGGAASTLGLTLTECPKIVTQAPRARDPYANVPEPAMVGPCLDGRIGHPTRPTTITPVYNHPSGVPSARFCTGLDIKGEVIFEPGLYLIEGGDFTFNGGSKSDTSQATIRGSGVTFYQAATSSLKLVGSVHLALSPPTSGPFSGLLFFGARNANTASHSISGNSGSTLQGAIYYPASHIEFTGSSTSTGGCTQVIGNTVTMTGSSTLSSSCASVGTKPLMASEGVVIME